MVDRVKKIMNYYNMSVNAFAQKIEIKGTVRDASDKSIE